MTNLIAAMSEYYTHSTNLIIKKVTTRGRPKKQRVAKKREYNHQASKVLWFLLRNRNLSGLRFRKAYEFDNHYSDFFCHEKRFSIEIYSAQHLLLSDLKPIEELADVGKMNIRVMRIADTDIINDPEGTLKRIQENLS